MKGTLLIIILGLLVVFASCYPVYVPVPPEQEPGAVPVPVPSRTFTDKTRTVFNDNDCSIAPGYGKYADKGNAWFISFYAGYENHRVTGYLNSTQGIELLVLVEDEFHKFLYTGTNYHAFYSSGTINSATFNIALPLDFQKYRLVISNHKGYEEAYVSGRLDMSWREYE